jgi:hypothetical protein
MSLELFTDVKILAEQMEIQFRSRNEGDGMGSQMAAFCLYTCGLVACYLCKYPDSKVPQGDDISTDKLI